MSKEFITVKQKPELWHFEEKKKKKRKRSSVSKCGLKHDGIGKNTIYCFIFSTLLGGKEIWLNPAVYYCYIILVGIYDLLLMM